MKVYGVTGWKNAGKTTLVERLVTEISGRGLTVSTIKHAHHSADIDEPGRDSYEHRAAGAHEVVISSARRWALMHENLNETEASLDELLEKMEPVDLVLVEGFKREAFDKLEIHRRVVGKPLLAPDDENIVAVAVDDPVSALDRPQFDVNDTKGIADFIVERCGLSLAPTSDTSTADGGA